MFKYRLIPILLVVLMIWVACSDDDNPTKSFRTDILGVWMFDSMVTGDNVSLDPLEDTLTFRKDLTGSYRSRIGWGPYEFDFSINGDSIFRYRTEGQAAGASDTLIFETDGNSFTYRRSGSIWVYYLSKL